MNRLAAERSAYLRHAADQKIDWFPWGDEAFARAAAEDKPVFLSSGAVWCHWCHVMAKESFADEEVAGLLNAHFVCVKLDRDERPDIDRRYQRAVSAMGNGGGWPLSVFLTPDRRPFFGGTYFPPEDGFGRPGFRKILRTVADFYRSNRASIAEYADQLIRHLQPGAPEAGQPGPEMLAAAEAAMLASFDPQNGGFGTAPKFPMAGALDFLMVRHFRTGGEAAGAAVSRTLLAMATGGFHDQLGGGFHRYSVDEAWIVPHFEKMADDNAWLLRLYLNAYTVFGTPVFRETAREIVSFVQEVLADTQGGFYTSQDADVTPDDEGGYFTWTAEEFGRVLEGEMLAVAQRHFLHDRGGLHHDAAKRVLFIAEGVEEIAAQTGIDSARVADLIAVAKQRLRHARDLRRMPFVDRTLYASLNGMMATSFLHAARVLGDASLKEFALSSLERVLATHVEDDRVLHAPGVAGLLDDYVFLVEALLAAYEATAERAHLIRAEQLMDSCLARFWDAASAGFFDAEDALLGIRLKGVEDVPHPSANAAGIMQLIRLAALSGRDDYYRRAGSALAAFAEDAKNLELHAGYYFIALDAYLSLIRVEVGGGPENGFAAEALSSLIPARAIVYGGDPAVAVPCVNGICLEPLVAVERLRGFLKTPVVF